MLTPQQLDRHNREVLVYVRQFESPYDAIDILCSALGSVLAAQFYDQPYRIDAAIEALRRGTHDAANANKASPGAIVIVPGQSGVLDPHAAQVSTPRGNGHGQSDEG